MEGTKATADVLSVSVELKSGYVLLAHLPRKSPGAKHRALITNLGKLPRWLRRSLTTDSGTENAGHQATTAVLGLPVYFCHPYHSWEKGAVENVIGLLRQYLPKRTSLSGLTPAELALVAARLNRRERNNRLADGEDSHRLGLSKRVLMFIRFMAFAENYVIVALFGCFVNGQGFIQDVFSFF